MKSKKAVAADVTIPVILPPANSSSSSSAPAPPTPTWSSLQVVKGIVLGAPVLPVRQNGCPAAAGEMLRLVADGNVRGVVAAATTNSHRRACGRIPMICPRGFIDLNAGVPDAAGEPQEDERRLVMCAYCNCEFCFGEFDVPMLNAPPGYIYEKLAVPASAGTAPQPVVGPLYGDGGLPALGSTTPAPLLVCSDVHHFLVAMGMLNLPPDATCLVWRRPTTLCVVPVSVGDADGSPQREEEPAQRGSSSAPPRAPATAPKAAGYAGDRWEFVMPGHEDMVRLTLAQQSCLDLNLSL